MTHIPLCPNTASATIKDRDRGVMKKDEGDEERLYESNER
jgi:hypothetical protein